MKAQEMADKIKSDSTFNGLDIWVDPRGLVEVYGFNATPDWRMTKATLESLGFKCAPNMGRYEADEECSEERDEHRHVLTIRLPGSR